MLKGMRVKYRNSVIYKSIIISFIIIVLLTFVLGITLYIRAENALENTVYRYNEILVDGVANKVSQCRQQIDEVMENLLNNEKIINIMNSETYSYDDAVDIMYDLQRIRMLEYIADINIYIDEFDIMISGNNIMDSNSFFEHEKYKADNFTYDTWRKTFLEGVQYKKFFPPVTKNFGNHEEKIVFYGQSFPQQSIDNIKGRIYILIDAEEMINSIKLSRDIENGNLFVLDSNRNVILSTTEDKTVLRQTVKYMKGKTRGVVQSRDGNNVCVYVRSKTGLNDWTCLYLISKNDFLAELYSFRNVIFIVLFIYILVAIVGVIAMANKIYAPIKRAVSKINITPEVAVTNRYNEMDLIMNHVEGLEQQKNKIESMAYKQALFGRSAFLMRLLQNQIGKSERTRMMSAFNISFPYGHFCVIAVKPVSCGVFCNKNFVVDWELLSLAISNVLYDIIESTKIGSGYVINNKIAMALINVDIEKATDFEAEIREMLSAFIDTMKREFDIEVSIGVSELDKGIDCISECYESAMAALDFGISVNDNPIVFFSVIKEELTKKKLYYYSFESENRITNYICQGDYENVSKVLDEIMSVNVKLALNNSMKKRLYYDLVGTLLRTIRILNIDETVIDELLLLEGNAFEKLSLNESFSLIKEKYKYICNMVSDINDIHFNGLLDDCKKYIRENYMNFNISVSMLADYFDVSRQSIFNLFKQSLNISPSDYIANVRIEKAKQLLCNSRLSNVQIANAVGFTNDATFVRTFKKSEGITPKQYREMKIA